MSGGALFAQPNLVDWSELWENRMRNQDFIAFQRDHPDWVNKGNTPQIKDSVPIQDALEIALEPWGADKELEDICIQKFMAEDMLLFRVAHMLHDLHGHEIDAAWENTDLPPALRWIPAMMTAYDHAYRGEENRKGLWALTVIDAESAGIPMDTMVDERMIPYASTNAAIWKLERLQRRFPKNPERVLVGFVKGMTYGRRWSAEPGYSKDLDEWLSLYRVFSRLMVNLEADDEQKMWGETLQKWLPISCLGTIERATLNAVLGMDETVQYQLLPWWTGDELSCPVLNEFAPVIPAYWADIWNANSAKLAHSTTGDAGPIHLINNTKEPTVETGKEHRVQAGETLTRISKLYGVTVAQIQGWNGLTSDLLSISQTLLIYPTEPVFGKDMHFPEIDCMLYTVKAEDTVWNISQRFDGIEPEQLASINGIIDVIFIGQVLCIPRNP